MTERAGGLAITSVLLADGRIRAVADLPLSTSGRPDVYCPFCGQPGRYHKQREAKNYTEHFAHLESEQCLPHDLENALHRRAIFMLLRWLKQRRLRGLDIQVRIPCRRCGTAHVKTIARGGTWDAEAREIRVEAQGGYRVPDVLIRHGAKPICLFEVGHTSLVDDGRRASLESVGVPGLEFLAHAIVEQLTAHEKPAQHRPLPVPRQHWNLELAPRDFLVCNGCRVAPAYAADIITIIRASQDQHPEFGARAELARFLGLGAEVTELSPEHLVLAFKRPEDLRVLDPSTASELAGRRQLDVAGLRTLTRKALGWSGWSVWRETSLDQVFHNPYAGIIQRITKSLGDTTTLAEHIGRLEKVLERAEQLTRWLERDHVTTRVECHVAMVVAEHTTNNHTTIELNNLLAKLEPRLPDLRPGSLAKTLHSLSKSKVLVWHRAKDGVTKCALKEFGRAEKNAAADIRARLSKAPASSPGPRRTPKQTLSREQCQAVDVARSSTMMLITGGAGAGKSTLIRELVTQAPDRNWLALAPTWKAVSALNDSLRGLDQPIKFTTVAGFNASTSGLRMDGKWLPEQFCEYYGSNYNVVVDEVGFLDSRAFELLLRGSRDTNQLVLVGDPNQLASIGPGAVLRDLISSGRIPHVRLGGNYRAQSATGIPQFANAMLAGQFNPFGAGVQFTDAKSTRVIIEQAAAEYVRALESCGVLDVQIITSINKICDALNDRLRDVCNKRGAQVHKRLRVGDPIIVNDKNIPGAVLIKGETGILRRITAGGKLKLEFEGRDPVLIDECFASTIETAYCITVHKSQGSQWRHVIVGIPWNPHEGFVDRAMLYTSATRARETVSIIGQRSVMRKAVLSNASAYRQTLLGDFLQS